MKSYSTTPSLLTTLAFSALVLTAFSAHAATPFTIAVIGDQQVPVNRDNYTQLYTSFTAQTDWIAANAQANKIRFVTQVGDIIEHGDDLAEFSRAEAAMATLDTATNADGGTGMPWNVNYGNHEVNWGAPGSDPAGADADNYRDYFGSGSGTHRYAGQPEYGGVSSNDLNTWHIIKSSNAADAREYLMLNLEYDVPGHAPGSIPNPADVPTFDAIAWAWDIIAQHPGMPTIVTTHVFEGSGFGPPNNPYTSGPGRNSQLQIFDKLVKDNPQIFMVLSGHTSQDSHQVKTNTAGLKVLQMVTDYNKVRPNGGDGFFRLVELNEDAGEINVQTYTPGVPQNPTPRFDTSANGEFTVTMDWATRFPSPSGPVMGPPSITNVTDDGATIESQLTNEDADDVTLVWAYADQGETGVATWTSAPGGGSHSFGSAVADEVLTHVLSGLDGDTIYRVRFFATGGGDSDWSSAAAFATGLIGLPAPGSFAGVSGTVPGGTKVDLSWIDGFDNESGFVIRRSADPAFGAFDEFTVGADATSYTDDATEANTTYYYRIAGTGSTGAGTFSANIEVTTGDAESGPTAGLVGHWEFDDGSGTVATDSSAFGRHADRIVAAGGWISGKNGGAYNLPRFALDASESNALNLAGGGAVSISAWITNRTATASFEGIAGFEKSGGSTGDVYSLKMDNADKINWTVLPSHGPLASADTLASYAAATADGWVHVVGVFEQGVGSTLYVNGAVAASTSAAASPIGTETTAFAIGSYDNGGNGFTGSVDEVRVYNVALTAADVADLGDLGGGDPVAPQVMRGPYLQSAGHDRMTVRWRTNIAGIGVVRYGTTAGVLDQSTSPGTAETEHVVPITGLTPDTVYYYEIETQNGTAIATVGDDASHFFKTHPTPGTSEPSRIWVIGDSGTTTTAKQDVYDAYRNRGEDTDVWLMLGDNAYNNGTDAEFQAAVFDSYPELLRNTPLWSCIGNHEAYTSGGQPYLDLHTFPTAGESGGVASGTERYYSFDYGDIHFVCIDSETAGNYDDAPGGGGMVDWLELDLQATDKNWIIAYFHHGPYTKGSHDSDTETQHIVMRQYVVPLLEQYGVDLVLSGHSHCYERSMLINGHHSAMSTADSTSGTFDPLVHVIDGGNGSAVGSVDGSGSFVVDGGDGVYEKLPPLDKIGTVYSTCGASGKLSSWDNGSDAVVNPAPHPVFMVNLRVMGSMIIDVDGETLNARYIDGANSVRDDFTIRKIGVGLFLSAAAATALADDGATVESQLYNVDADEVTVVWAYADQGETTVADWTNAPGGGSHSFGATSQDTVLSRVLTGLDGDSAYSVRFFATAGGESSWSAPENFVTGLGDSPAPPDFAAVAGTTATSTKVDLTWTDSFSNETGFLIHRSTDPGFATYDEFPVAANLEVYTDDTTAANTAYHYRIAGSGSSGTGTFSAGVQVTTGDDPGGAPVASLIGHWTFDEGSGTTAADSSANGNTATLAGSAGSWVTGESGSAYQLTDPVSRFEIADSSDLQVTGAVTVSAWVKPFAASRYGLIAGVDQTGGTGSDMYALKTGVSDTLNWQVIGASSSVSLNGATLMSLSNSGADWVHVAGVYDPSGFAGLYVNGSLVDSTTTGVPTSIQSKPATPFQMGYNASDGGDGGSNGLDSALDDVQVYNQALTATEIAFLYSNPGSPISLPPSAPFEEWATTNISDINPSADATFGGNPDGDPFANGLEWALGGDPLGFDSMAELLGHGGDAIAGLTLTFTREDTSEGEANLAIEFSSDLFDADINVSPIPAASGTAGGVDYTITENGSAPDDITATIPAGSAVDGRLFGRIRATEN